MKRNGLKGIRFIRVCFRLGVGVSGNFELLFVNECYLEPFTISIDSESLSTEEFVSSDESVYLSLSVLIVSSEDS